MIFGIVSIFMLTACGIPQVYRTIKTKQIKNISPVMWWMLVIGQLSGIIYMLQQPEIQLAILITYCINLVIASIYLIIYYIYKNAEDKRLTYWSASIGDPFITPIAQGTDPIKVIKRVNELVDDPVICFVTKKKS